MLFLLLARCAAFMATPVVTSRRPDPKDDFPSTLSVLSTWGTSIRLPLEDLDCSRSARTSSMLVNPLSGCSRPTPG
ncbi:hypothetical protein DPMN_130954 [Dreissena polymorpha]|uniref:Secreted protein n=1 Tax=Dreissena polymorpha TaxID=45954 RepID=A0A9D4JYV1_DREPO|nr:hypothetical protein DPMN_130954 [Dreissena polymorpha]